MLLNQTRCRKCGLEMQTVATIEPMWGKPGLVAFICSSCGGTNSVLVYPAGQVGHGDRKKARRISDYAER